MPQDEQMRRWRESVDGIDVEVMAFSEPVDTVEKASRLSGASPSAIAKTLVFKTFNDATVIVIARGDRKVDLSRLSKELGEAVRFATAEEVREVLGQEVGGVSPINPRLRGLRVIVDPAILGLDEVVCGGGSPYRLYRVRVRDLLAYLKPETRNVFR